MSASTSSVPSSVSTGRHWLLPVTGMHCAACATRLQKVLQHKPGVQMAEVNLATAQANLTTTPDVTFELLQGWVAQTGFAVPVQEMDFTITGISCAACVQRIEKRLRKEPGVLAVAVNVASGQTFLLTWSVPLTLDCNFLHQCLCFCVTQSNSMRNHSHKYRLHIIRNDKPTFFNQCICLSCFL